MPELPEVEQFRQVLLPLVSTSQPLRLSLLPDKDPPKSWISASDIAALGDDCYCTDVVRQGKQLVMVLESKTDEKKKTNQKNTSPPWYLFLHMGMTGSITSPGRPMGWGHEGNAERKSDDNDSFPPKYAYLLLSNANGDYRAAFCDPRKFGKTELRTDLAPLHALAPDAWQGPAEPMASNLTHKSLGIKALLLDQKKACAGVGNWVADEVLYQCQMHPDQSFLTADEASQLVQVLQSILATAVDCLAQHVPYPSNWLFPYRWTKKKAGKDGQGRSITFVQSGGRTSAIIASVQRLYKRKRPADGGAAQPVVGGRPTKKSKRGNQKDPAASTADQEQTSAVATPATSQKATKRSQTSASGSPSEAAVPKRRRSPRLVTP